MHRWIPALTGLLLGVAFAPPANATPLPAVAGDGQTRTLTGLVTDTAGTPLAHVRVRVLEAGRSAETGTDGHYTIPQLPTGAYGVSFALVGYAPVVRRVTITAADVTVDVRLRPSLVRLQEVQVTATPLATTSMTSPQPTSVVGGGSLDLSQAPTLGRTLEGLAGVRNYSTGQGIGKPVIRGLSSNRILVLDNGQRVESQQWGDEHGPNIETATADRVEVIRGPQSVLYGSDALGGVINVIERDLPDAIGKTPFARARVNAAYNTNGDSPDATAMLEGARGSLGFRGSLTGRSAGNVETPAGRLGNSGNRALGGEGALGVRRAWGSLRAKYSYRSERVEIHEDPAEDPAATPFQRIGTHRAELALNIPIRLARLQVDAGYERNDRREFESKESSDVALGLLSQTWTANAHFHHAPLGPFSGILGASYLRTDVGKYGEESLVPPSLANDYGVFAFEQTEHGPWHFSAGARYDHRTLDVDAEPALGVTAQRRTYNSLTGNVGALYRLSEPLALVLNVGRGFRAPSSFDLFANGVHEGTGRFERGNPALRNETSLNTDLALRVQSGRINAEVGGFVNLIQNYIYPKPAGETDPESGFPVYDVAQGDARLAGFEGSSEYHATSWLHLKSTADYTRGQNTSLDIPLAFIPAFRVTYSATLERPSFGQLTDLYLTVGGETNARQTRTDPQDFAPAGYTLANAGGGFMATVGGTQFAIDLDVRNLFDTPYRAFLSRYKTYADDPGRNAILRVTTAF